MATNEERLKILQMLQDGKITAEQAAGLLEALGEVKQEKASPRREREFNFSTDSDDKRWFRVQVTDTDTGKRRVNLRMPMGVVNSGLKMGMRFVPEIEGVDVQDLLEMIGNGSQGKIVDVYDDKDGEHVEVFIE
jgi:hypothetical protein